MGIFKKTGVTKQLSKSKIPITITSTHISVPDDTPKVGPGYVVEWVANDEFVIDFGESDNSPVNHGQFEFVSSLSGKEHRVAIVAKKPFRAREFPYYIRTAKHVLDPAIIIDPNKKRRAVINS